MKKCSTGKKLYASEALAEDALIEARVQFDYAQGQGPIAVYLCTECRHYHLTSKGAINKRLASLTGSGELEKLKQASRWMDKLGRK